MPKLTQTQIEAVRTDGYLVIEEALPSADLDGMTSAFTDTVSRNASRAVEQGLIEKTFPDEPFETRLARIVESAPDPKAADEPASALFNDIRGKLRSSQMFQIMTHPDLLDIVESLIGPEILVHPQYNVRAKLPNQDRSSFRGTRILATSIWMPKTPSWSTSGSLSSMLPKKMAAWRSCQAAIIVISNIPKVSDLPETSRAFPMTSYPTPNPSFVPSQKAASCSSSIEPSIAPYPTSRAQSAGAWTCAIVTPLSPPAAPKSPASSPEAQSNPPQSPTPTKTGSKSPDSHSGNRCSSPVLLFSFVSEPAPSGSRGVVSLSSSRRSPLSP
jgi:hypothetical protein